MSTITQLKKRIHIKKKQCLVKALKKCPQKKGICTKILIHTPKKPSSAKRKLMRVRLSSKKFVFAYIPGEGVQTLRAFSRVLVRGGSRPDLPGVHYIIIRGKLDLSFLDLRRQGRSKYGMKAIFRPRKKDRYNAFSFLTEKKKIELSTLFLKNSKFLKYKIKENIYSQKLKKKIIYFPFLLRQKRNTSFMFFNFFFKNYDHYPDSLFYFKKKIKKINQRYFFLYKLRIHKNKIKQKRIKNKRNIAQ